MSLWMNNNEFEMFFATYIYVYNFVLDSYWKRKKRSISNLEFFLFNFTSLYKVKANMHVTSSKVEETKIWNDIYPMYVISQHA